MQSIYYWIPFLCLTYTLCVHSFWVSYTDSHFTWHRKEKLTAKRGVARDCCPPKCPNPAVRNWISEIRRAWPFPKSPRVWELRIPSLLGMPFFQVTVTTGGSISLNRLPLGGGFTRIPKSPGTPTEKFHWIGRRWWRRLVSEPPPIFSLLLCPIKGTNLYFWWRSWMEIVK